MDRLANARDLGKLRKHGDADRLSGVAFQLEAPKDAPKYCAGQMPRCFAINQPRLCRRVWIPLKVLPSNALFVKPYICVDVLCFAACMVAASIAGARLSSPSNTSERSAPHRGLAPSFSAVDAIPASKGYHRPKLSSLKRKVEIVKPTRQRHSCSKNSRKCSNMASTLSNFHLASKLPSLLTECERSKHFREFSSAAPNTSSWVNRHGKSRGLRLPSR